jgi:hypothetical protein
MRSGQAPVTCGHPHRFSRVEIRVVATDDRVLHRPVKPPAFISWGLRSTIREWRGNYRKKNTRPTLDKASEAIKSPEY